MAWNQIAIMGTLAIWGFLVRWDTLIKPERDVTLFATQVAWAGTLSSLLIGLWRSWARRLDSDIVRLYPVIYLAERLHLPPELCTISPPEGTQPLSSATIAAGIEYRDVRTVDFGSRGHAALDWIGVSLIVLIAVTSILALSEAAECGGKQPGLTRRFTCRRASLPAVAPSGTGERQR